jgi:hypothetical protein
MADFKREIFGVASKLYRDMGDGTHAEVLAIVPYDEAGNEGVKVGSVTLPEGSPVAGQVAIASTGTAVPLSATSVALPSGTVIVRAHSGNSDDGAAGGSDVSNSVDGSGNGYVVEAGKDALIFAEDLADVYVNGTAGDIFSYSAA